MSARDPAWLAANQRAFTAAIEGARGLLLAALAKRLGETVPPPPAAPGPLTPPAAHADIAGRLRLSAFEHWLLLLVAGAEVDPEIRRLCGAWHGDAGADRPTFALALTVHPEPHWSALAPDTPLRRLGLIRLENGAGLTGRLLGIDELVLHHCLGLDALHLAVADRLARVAAEPVFAGWAGAITALRARLPHRGEAIGIEGDPAHARALAAAAAEGRGLYTPLPGEPLPLSDPMLARLAALEDAALLIDRAEDLDAAARWAPLMPVIAIGAAARRNAVVRVPDVARKERAQRWRCALNGAAPSDPDMLRRLADERAFSPADIDRIATAANEGEGDLATVLARYRRQRHEGLAALATRIEPRGRWDDLVLPEAQKAQLHQLIDQVRYRGVVLDDWGFGAKSSRGRGLSVLFAGPSGTGKTMASEIVAAALGRDLFRIDLAALVSKFIGETEKHLEQVFAAAEHGAAILLFDEADALFGKRASVRDAIDRYANQEVSYLLQRIESFDGLAIMTTNLADAIDPAFVRRFRFVLSFAFPDQGQRADIWRSVFPEKLPSEALDIGRLARLPLSGGAIRNVAVNGAYLAAAAGARLSMGHLLQAAEAELAKHNQRLPKEMLQ